MHSDRPEHKSEPCVPSTDFFSRKPMTLQTVTALALIEQLGSVENVIAYVKEIPNTYEHIIRQHIPEILARIKKLNSYVVENNLRAIDKYLDETPLHLIPVLLTTAIINQTPVKGMQNYVTVEASALRFALATQAFKNHGCDLFLNHSSEAKTTCENRLVLFDEGTKDSPFTYVIGGKEFSIKCANEEDSDDEEKEDAKDQLAPEHFHALKEMFQNRFYHNKNLNLDHKALAVKEKYQAAYAALLKITKRRGHTLFVKEESMLELLERHLKRALPCQEAELEVAKQTVKQFPEGYEEIEEKIAVSDIDALREIRAAIAASTSDQDPALVAALLVFKTYLEPDGNNVLTTGKYHKTALLRAALDLGDKQAFNDQRQNNFYYNQVIGWLQRLMQNNIKQDMAQGLSEITEEGQKSRNSLVYLVGFRDVGRVFTAEDKHIGIDSWLNVGGGMGEAGYDQESAASSSQCFSTFCTDQNTRLAEIQSVALQQLLLARCQSRT
jgi:hypothetical protein